MEPVTANRACVVTSSQSSAALWQRGVCIIIVHEYWLSILIIVFILLTVLKNYNLMIWGKLA